jgi:hypothetical protein
LAGADNFAVEESRAAEAIEWMNSYAKTNELKFQATLAGHSIQTVKFGSFQLYNWKGEWSTARNIARKASAKLHIKTIESGFHEKRDLFSAMLGGGSEFAKVYSKGRLVGNIQLVRKSGRWTAKAESFV